ncbi:hypothetical protein V3N99_19905 [Dermatophilaceae bacterium Soc4.6]
MRHLVRIPSFLRPRRTSAWSPNPTPTKAPVPYRDPMLRIF